MGKQLPRISANLKMQVAVSLDTMKMEGEAATRTLAVEVKAHAEADFATVNAKLLKLMSDCKEIAAKDSSEAAQAAASAAHVVGQLSDKLAAAKEEATTRAQLFADQIPSDCDMAKA